MAKVVTPITARVEVIGKLKEGNYGPYRSCLFIDQSQPEGSEEAKIWKSLTEEESAPLVKGAIVQLVPAGGDKNGNDRHNIVLMDAPTTPTTATVQPATPGLTPDQKRAIATFGTDIVKAWAFLYREARKELGDEACEETVRACASSALIACQRKLGFDR